MKIRFYNIIIGFLVIWHLIGWPCESLLGRMRKKRWAHKLNKINNLHKKGIKS